MELLASAMFYGADGLCSSVNVALLYISQLLYYDGAVQLLNSLVFGLQFEFLAPFIILQGISYKIFSKK